MILIAENIRLESNSLSTAFRQRGIEPLRRLAAMVGSADVDYLDINTASAGQCSHVTMMWLVNAVQSATRKPLSLHTSDSRAMIAGLKVSCHHPLINTGPSESRSVQFGMAAAREYGTNLIVSLENEDGLPRTANERGVRALDLIDAGNNAGLQNQRMWLDPVLCPLTKGTSQIKAVFDFLRLMRQIAPGCKSVVELSRVSEGSPPHLRPYLNRTCLIMLLRYGLSAAVVDALDSELIEIARGRRPDLVYLIYRMMDGELPDRSSLSAEEMKYIIMVRTLNGETLHVRSRANAWKYSNCAV